MSVSRSEACSMHVCPWQPCHSPGESALGDHEQEPICGAEEASGVFEMGGQVISKKVTREL